MKKQYFSVDETRTVVAKARTLAMPEAATPARMRPVGQGSHKAWLDQATMGDEQRLSAVSYAHDDARPQICLPVPEGSDGATRAQQLQVAHVKPRVIALRPMRELALCGFP